MDFVQISHRHFTISVSPTLPQSPDSDSAICNCSQLVSSFVAIYQAPGQMDRCFCVPAATFHCILRLCHDSGKLPKRLQACKPAAICCILQCPLGPYRLSTASRCFVCDNSKIMTWARGTYQMQLTLDHAVAIRQRHDQSLHSLRQCPCMLIRMHKVCCRQQLSFFPQQRIVRVTPYIKACSMFLAKLTSSAHWKLQPPQVTIRHANPAFFALPNAEG